MPDNPEGSAAADGLAAELAAARESLRVEKEKHQMAANLARNKQQEAEQYKRQLQEAQSRNGASDPDEARWNMIRQEQIAQREQMDMMRFQREHPEADMTEILDVIQNSESVKSFTMAGEPNIYVTLKNSYNSLEAERARAARAEVMAAKAGQAQEQNRQRNQATISGVSGSVGQETIDISNLTSDQMLEKGLVEFDPRYPIKPLNRKT